MACEVVWTARAEGDLEDVVRYVAQDLASPQAAGALLDSFEEAVDLLAQTPGLFPVSTAPVLAARGLRVYPVKKYVMLYEYDGARVTVWRIFHGSRDYARLLARDAR